MNQYSHSPFSSPAPHLSHLSHPSHASAPPGPCPSPYRSNRVFLWVLALCAVILSNAPRLLISPEPSSSLAPTGYRTVDEMFYAACSRRVVEDGACGLFYANPFAFSANPPRVYSQLYFVLNGWIWKITGLSFPSIETCNRLIFGLLFLGLAGECFLWRFGRWKYFKPVVVLLFFGGGGAWVLASLQTLGMWAGPLAGDEDFSRWGLKGWLWGWYDQFHEFEGLYCTWGMNLFRRLSAGYQVFYHTLFYAGWLCLLRGKWIAAFLFSFLLWWAHPFTALDFAVPLAAFAVVEVRTENGAPKRLRRGRVGAALALLAAGLAYYLVWLPLMNPQHALTQRQMQGIGHVLAAWRLLPGLGALFFVPFLLYSFPPRRRSRSVAATLCLLAGVFGLTFHHWITGRFGVSFQPLHFEQGYLFFGLLFLTCEILTAREKNAAPQPGPRSAAPPESAPASSSSPELAPVSSTSPEPAPAPQDSGLAIMGGRGRPRWRKLVIAAAFLSLFPDNAVFYVMSVVPDARNPGVPVTLAQKDLVEWLAKQRGPRRILMLQESPVSTWGMYAAIETPHYLIGGHPFNTPDLAARTAKMKAFLRSADLGIWEDCAPDTLVAPKSRREDFEKRFLPRGEYKLLYENEEFGVYEILPHAPAENKQGR